VEQEILQCCFVLILAGALAWYACELISNPMKVKENKELHTAIFYAGAIAAVMYLLVRRR
jgi:hypothetical protein